ncbi:molybdopterin biosynthesis protein [Sporomusaceae bacterium FL31]|nr:molybdopterin biosynthesis protein [Sporomusaceae bacterium FL31]GCE35500.1 molybdopterin biosynthesis protein [Sporomusaceae bacterium]
MKSIDVSQAVGTVLGQDLTRIAPGQFKGVAFKKGHIIREEDIPIMRSMGKNNIYVFEITADQVHENDAAAKLATLAAGSGLNLTEAAEGKVDIQSDLHGLLKIDIDRLLQLNLLDGVVLSTLHEGVVVNAGQLIACAKIIPLLLPVSTIDQVETICSAGSLIQVLPFRVKTVGLIITGNEVYYGLIQDKFEAVIREKIKLFGGVVGSTVFLPDDQERVTEAITNLAQQYDLVIVTGGMSVDPDDITPVAIRQTGAEVAVYGTPVLPGAMFMAAYLDGKPVLGIPACGMYARITVLDVVLPKILAGEIITRQYIAALGHGGLCRKCADGCRYPDCSFAK